MKLITKELEERFKEVGNQYEKENPIIVAKFFNPVGSQTWYATEYNSQDKICYGYVTGMYVDEWGTFSVTELEAVNLPLGMKIERDLYFKEKTFEEEIEKKTIKRTTEIKLQKSNEDKSETLEK